MKEYEKWFRKAESDLLDIENNFSATITPIDTVCFHTEKSYDDTSTIKQFILKHFFE